jgi:hypothetical protein
MSFSSSAVNTTLASLRSLEKQARCLAPLLLPRYNKKQHSHHQIINNNKTTQAAFSRSRCFGNFGVFTNTSADHLMWALNATESGRGSFFEYAKEFVEFGEQAANALGSVRMQQLTGHTEWRQGHSSTANKALLYITTCCTSCMCRDYIYTSTSG